MRRKLRALGFTCGIGSMLVGARRAGFDVVGNVEWRGYYHARDAEGRNTFEANFPGAFLARRLDELSAERRAAIQGVDLIMGHPECGNFSNLNTNHAEDSHDPGDIPLFVDAIAELRPRFFAMDDLPKSFVAFSMEEYARRLPGYDLFPEWVSNWGYGNVQKQRNRFFMIGALKAERFTFRANEARHALTVKDVIGDLLGGEGKILNHDRHALREPCAKGLHLDYHGHRATWGDMKRYCAKLRNGAPYQYHGPNEEVKTRIGSYKGHWEGPAHVLTGGISGFHAIRCEPYSIRERARMQGFPDDFVFHGTTLNARGEWNHDRNPHMVRQTGKAMPIQFCEHVARLAAACALGRKIDATDSRVIPANPHVSQAKTWYCRNVGYGDAQRAACDACWLRRECPMTLAAVEEGTSTSRKEKDHESSIARGAREATRPKTRGSRRTRAEGRTYDGAFEPSVKSW